MKISFEEYKTQYISRLEHAFEDMDIGPETRTRMALRHVGVNSIHQLEAPASQILYGVLGEIWNVCANIEEIEPFLNFTLGVSAFASRKPGILATAYGYWTRLQKEYSEYRL